MIRLKRIIEQNNHCLLSLTCFCCFQTLVTDYQSVPCVGFANNFGSHIWRELMGLSVFHQIISIDFLSC